MYSSLKEEENTATRFLFFKKLFFMIVLMVFCVTIYNICTLSLLSHSPAGVDTRPYFNHTGHHCLPQ